MVEKRILSGDLSPGTLLPTEAALADQFGVNRLIPSGSSNLTRDQLAAALLAQVAVR